VNGTGAVGDYVAMK
jgi:serine/threonine protein kinase